MTLDEVIQQLQSVRDDSSAGLPVVMEAPDMSKYEVLEVLPPMYLRHDYECIQMQVNPSRVAAG
ncbi:hypothetical protein S1361_12865 [Streptomyces cyanogenus]|uniref:Uncharacterized protein n=1 Tax=Streptomyces cyanogenus TaxID=80860 RepID=A0ABX7TNQ3_STRCY|nr:hypothetical protein S1361_12865 [Streptomyces cyanogenus]